MHFCLNTSALTIYVAKSGNLCHKAKHNSPYSSLAKAASVAASGDIIHVNAGTYTLSSGVAIPVGVSVEGDGSVFKHSQ